MARILFLITSLRAAAVIGCVLSIGGDDGAPIPAPCARVVLLFGSIILSDWQIIVVEEINRRETSSQINYQ